MREAMKNAVVGDDVYSDDPTVNQLQADVAKLFGKEASLFVPSGTMGNLIGMMVNVRNKGDGAIIGSESHVYRIERGGISALASIHPMVVQNKPDGTLDLKQVEYIIPPNNIHLPQPKVLVLENSHNVCNGRVLPMSYVKKTKKLCDQHNLRMHLDGARCLNAAVTLGIEPHEMVKDFNTISLCLSKGLGSPIGSVLIGSHEDIQLANMYRKMLGGQMRQVGTIASCALISLEDWKEKLAEDHKMAKHLINEFANIKGIKVKPELCETNIFRFALESSVKKFTHKTLCQHLKEKYSILVNPTFELDFIRVVTHRDVNYQDLDYFAKSLKETLN